MGEGTTGTNPTLSAKHTPTKTGQPVYELDSDKKAGGSFEAILRFYGPEKTFLDKVWTLGDIEEVKP